MDQCRDGVTLLGDTTLYGLKHMLPECFVSVKLETYEEGSCSEPQQFSVNVNSVNSTSVNNTAVPPSDDQPPSVYVNVQASHPQQRSCCNQDASTCNCSGPKQTCLAPCSTPSASASPQIVYQYQPSTSIMQQQQQPPPPPQQQAGNPSQPSQSQQQPTSQATSSVGRSGPPAHSFSHPHPRTAPEISWLSHSYVPDPATAAATQGAQHFHHQMPYLPDAPLLAQAQGEGVRIMKQSSASPPCRPDTASSSTITGIGGLAGGEVGDSNNAFINYVLNQQRGGVAAGGIFLFDPSRGLPPHHAQQSNGESTRHDETASLHSIKINVADRPVEDSSRNSTPVAGHDSSDTGSTTESPKPGEGNLVSRYCQTVVTMSQLQDAAILPEAKIIIETPEPDDSKEKAFEADGEESHEITIEVDSEGTYSYKKSQKRINSSSTHFSGRGNFGQRPTLNCQGHLENVDPCLNGCTGEGKCGAGHAGSGHSGQCLDCGDQTQVQVQDHTQVQAQTQTQGGLTQLKSDETSSSKMSTNGKVTNSGFPYLDIDRPFRCDICGKTYTTHQALVNHERYHRGDRPYECETCHKAFATNSHLVTHRRTHTGERPFQCQLCHRCFADRSAFVKHERTHGPNGVIIKRYKCEECGNGFVDSCGLKKHTRIHTGERPYVCNVCEKSFSTSSTFVAHKRIHTGERPYKCDSCDKMFITKSHLLTHRRTHTGEKPFTCSVCNRCFADGSSFRRHERLHTGENRHVCDLCGKGFPLESSLEKHKQTHVQSNNFTYMYENRNDLNCVTSQQQPSCDMQSNRTGSVIPVVQVREPQPDRSNMCVDLSREMTGEVQVNRSNMCAVASRDMDCDNQNNRSNIMVPAREIA